MGGTSSEEARGKEEAEEEEVSQKETLEQGQLNYGNQAAGESRGVSHAKTQ